MRWHYVQHVPFEGPGHFARWAQTKGYAVTSTPLWEDRSLPRTDSFDGLLVLGGPMNVYEEDRFPWLKREKEFIREAVSAGKILIGICLGAQLLSVALGGAVTPNEQREIGWGPVRLTPDGRTNHLFQGFPDQFNPFHWHGDRFSIPEGAVHAAESEGCENQAFVFEDRVVGLQFHLETTEEGIGLLLENCGEEITPGPYVQLPSSIRGQVAHLRQAHALMTGLLDALTTRWQ